MTCDERRALMRAYSRAMTAIGQRYPAERGWLYSRLLLSGVKRGTAYHRALSLLREQHLGEFAQLYEENRNMTDGLAFPPESS